MGYATRSPDLRDDEPDDGFDMAMSPARSPMATPDIRSRLHAICALYAHTACPKARVALLDRLERLALQAAQALAVDLLENGWRSEHNSLAHTYPDNAPAIEVRPQPRRT